jgi:hypothetical protein
MSATQPGWQQRETRGREFLPVFGALSLAVLASGLLGLIVYGMGHRLAGSEPRESFARATLPSDLPVALAGTILQIGAQPTWAQAFATLLDLARRGIVAIEEAPLGRWRQTEFVLRLHQPRASLRPHERGFTELIFLGKSGWEDHVKLSSVRPHIASHWKRFREPVKDELRSAGLVDPAREGTRRVLRNLGIVLVLVGGLGLVIAAIAIEQFGPWMLLVPASLEVVGISALIMGTTFSPLSENGAWAASAWRGFARHLKELSHGPQPPPDPNLFERYLPYAAAFNLGTRWVKMFVKKGQPAALPPWFRALSDSGHDSGAAFTAFIASTSGAAGGGSVGGGGGGAGGGGSSGAH